MSDLAQNLIELKRVIQQAETALNESKGGLKQIKKRMQTEFQVGSVKEAKAKCRTLQKEHDRLESQLLSLKKKIKKVLGDNP